MEKLTINKIEPHGHTVRVTGVTMDGKTVSFPVASFVPMDDKTLVAEEYRHVPGQSCQLFNLRREYNGIWVAEAQSYRGGRQVSPILPVQAITDGINDGNWYDLLPSLH
jgi:hypothetical protein